MSRKTPILVGVMGHGVRVQSGYSSTSGVGSARILVVGIASVKSPKTGRWPPGKRLFLARNMVGIRMLSLQKRRAIGVFSREATGVFSGRIRIQMPSFRKRRTGGALAGEKNPNCCLYN